MAVSDHYMAYIVDKLSAVAPVRASRMFEGAALYHNGQLFAILANDKLYFKTDADGRRDFEAFGAAPFRPCLEDKAPSSSYYYQLPDAVLNNKRKLKQWMQRACCVGTTATVSLAG